MRNIIMSSKAQIPAFITMIGLCALTALAFLVVLVDLRWRYRTSFDRFQLFSVGIFLILVASTAAEGTLGIR
jgi:hypothetical protein